MPEYKKIAKVSDIKPGEAKEFEIEGELIALFNIDGKIYATTNTCPHQAGPLGQGELDKEIVTCPWHGWKFNVKTGDNVMFPAIKIKTFPVKIEHDEIFVGID